MNRPADEYAHYDFIPPPLASWRFARNPGTITVRDSTMLHDVVSATYKGGYRIDLVFDNGAGGVVDFSPYLEYGGVFTRFRDMSFFRQFQVDHELGILTWPDGIDVAPETLYAQATGSPLPDWMNREEVLMAVNLSPMAEE